MTTRLPIYFHQGGVSRCRSEIAKQTKQREELVEGCKFFSKNASNSAFYLNTNIPIPFVLDQKKRNNGEYYIEWFSARIN